MLAPLFPSRGGVIKANRALLTELAKRHQVTAVVPMLDAVAKNDVAAVRATLAGREIDVEAGAGCDRFQLDGIEVVGVNGRAAVREQLALTLRSVKPDWVLLSSDEPAQILLSTAVREKQGQIAYFAHTALYLPFGPGGFASSPKRTELLRQVDVIFNVSDYMVEYCREYAGLNSTRFYMPAYGEGPFRKLAKREHAVTMINPCAVKGMSVFFELARRMPEVSFLAVSSWGTTDADRATLASLPNVSLIPSVEDMDEIWAQTSVLLTPSLWVESFGLVVVEAMLRGVPVLASDVGGLPEAKLGTDYVLPVQPIRGYSGKLDQNMVPVPVMEQQDIEPWLVALRRLLNEPELYEQQSRSSQETATAFVSSLRLNPLEEILSRSR